MTATVPTASGGEVPSAPKPSRRRSRYTLRESALGLGFLLPSLAVFAVFFYYPFIKLVGWGTYKPLRGGADYRQVGLEQYQEVLGGDQFKDGLWHSILYVVYTVPLGVVLGILLAVAAHRRLKGIKVFQAIFSSTLASSVAVSSVVFFYLLNPQVGMVRSLGSWGESAAGWTLNPDTSLWAAALPSIWQNLGLAFVIVLAGLQAVPDEVLEAARLDGYGPIRRLTRIILPLISPVLMFLTVVLVIFAFQAFAQIEIVTNGGPAGSSETLVFKIFRSSQDYTKGAVMSVGLFLVTLVVTFLQFTFLERRVHYGDE